MMYWAMMYCFDCDSEFEVIDDDDVICPECDSYEVFPIHEKE